jgi:hypothetical protein
MPPRAEFAFFFSFFFLWKRENHLRIYVKKKRSNNFVKVGNHINKSEKEVRNSQLGYGGESKKVFIFSAPSNLPNMYLSIILEL